MLTFTLLSKNDDIISALRNLNYRLFIKVKLSTKLFYSHRFSNKVLSWYNKSMEKSEREGKKRYQDIEIRL